MASRAACSNGLLPPSAQRKFSLLSPQSTGGKRNATAQATARLAFSPISPVRRSTAHSPAAARVAQIATITYSPVFSDSHVCRAGNLPGLGRFLLVQYSSRFDGKGIVAAFQ